MASEDLNLIASAARARVEQHRLGREREAALRRVRAGQNLTAAWKPLSSTFLSAKAKLQPRDSKGRWIEMGAMVRWLDGVQIGGSKQNAKSGASGEKSYKMGRVIAFDAGTRRYTVVPADGSSSLALEGRNLEVVDAVIPETPEEVARLSEAPTGYSAPRRPQLKNAELNGYERSGVLVYASGSGKINRFLRATPEEQKTILNEAYDEGDGFDSNIPDLDAAIRKQKTTRDGSVYRGLRLPDGTVPFKPGDVVQDKGFVSTSGDAGSAYDNFARNDGKGAIVEIRVPAGTNMLDVNATGEAAWAYEDELLLPRGGMMRIDVVTEPDENGVTRVTASWLGTDQDQQATRDFFARDGERGEFPGTSDVEPGGPSAEDVGEPAADERLSEPPGITAPGGVESTGHTPDKIRDLKPGDIWIPGTGGSDEGHLVTEVEDKGDGLIAVSYEAPYGASTSWLRGHMPADGRITNKRTEIGHRAGLNNQEIQQAPMPLMATEELRDLAEEIDFLTPRDIADFHDYLDEVQISPGGRSPGQWDSIQEFVDDRREFLNEDQYEQISDAVSKARTESLDVGPGENDAPAGNVTEFAKNMFQNLHPDANWDEADQTAWLDAAKKAMENPDD